jgi:hypothetical protein
MEQPYDEYFKTKISKISEFISFACSICSSVIFILERAKIISKEITEEQNYLILPIVSFVAFLVWYFIPDTITKVKDKLKKILDKEHHNEFEISEIATICKHVNEKHETISQRYNIKPFVQTREPLSIVENYIEEVEPPGEETEEDDTATRVYVDNQQSRYKVKKLRDTE